MLLRAFSEGLLNTDRLGALTISPGRLFQCLTTLSVKKCFLMSILFYSILFYSILFYSIDYCGLLSYSICFFLLYTNSEDKLSKPSMIIPKHHPSHYTFSEIHIFNSALRSIPCLHTMFVCCLIYCLEFLKLY